MPKGLSFAEGSRTLRDAGMHNLPCQSKCDGVKPVCGSCAASGKNDKCSWGRDTGRKYTEAHIEALKKRAESLQAYGDQLEAMLARCVCQDVSSQLQFRPQEPGEQSEQGGESETDALDLDEEITRELAVPVEHLKARHSIQFLRNLEIVLRQTQLDDRSGGLLLNVIAAPTITGGTNAAPRVQEVVENPDASYVLQVEGIDVSQSHPEIDWSRHLPPDVILERREHDKVLDLSFKFLTMWTFRIIPSLFLRDMYRALSVPRSKEPPRTPHYSPMLHNAILSLSLAFSDEPYLRDPKTRLCFAAAAKSLHAYTKADLSTIQAMAFLGSFYSDFGERIPAELYFGMSNRLGITLGLGLDATPWAEAGLIEIDEIKWRNWSYWTLFCLDALWALYFGWDLGGPSRRSTPMPFVDSDMDQNLWYHAPANIPPQPNYLTLIFCETSALFVIACQISELVNNLRPSTQQNAAQAVEQIAKIDLELNNWKRRLPPQLDITPENRASSTPQRLMLHLGYWWCSLTLHRPFFNCPAQRIQHSNPEVDHIKLCLRAAEKILELIETWSSLYTLHLSALTTQGIVFSAGTVFLLCALQATAGPRIERDKLQAMLVQVQTCIRYLQEMGGTWPSATRTGNMLQAILNDRLRPVIIRRLAHRGVQMFTATTLDREIPAAPSMHKDHETGLPAEAASLYVPEWDSQLDPAPGWSKQPLDNFFEQMQNAPAAFGVGDQAFPASMGAAAVPELTFPELDTSGFLMPNFDYFRSPVWQQEPWDQDLAERSARVV
ncbi:Zn(2)-C6 fungal-type domain-containing protein [Mycena venus]|uniref:Zn(2)-C6 fungal-type domain-containing protein n=1 Tax=Mycena venus TaxID=2733690 RepID=A0A8H6YK83_9AGAR|nr:Zn(2)-C6 fungal-type domain-containing protein [Mycena venus]